MFLDPFKLLASSTSVLCRRPGADPPGPAASREEAAPVWPQVATALSTLHGTKPTQRPL